MALMKTEFKEHLEKKIIPFWKNLRDEVNGGYWGWVASDLEVMKKAPKGCILHSRILWFFSNAYLATGNKELLDCARHAYDFIVGFCMDNEFGGMVWEVSFDGKPLDYTKHTYNQAFCVYALSSYYDASGDAKALESAMRVFEIIEGKCKDSVGYLEAFDRKFAPIANEKLSENGIIAEKTMNTLLHVFEAFTELFRVSGDLAVKEQLRFIMGLIAETVYNPSLRRLEVFFDENMDSILDIHSFGHDIEASWLLDRGLEVLGDDALAEKLSPISRELARNIRNTAFDGRSIANESAGGNVNEWRIWWAQAEAVVGFKNAGYEEEAQSVWKFIEEFLVDGREGGEWYWQVDAQGSPDLSKPVVEPWKCPYHNGRMCLEMMRRLG
ncbi:MAG: AGE family epimerase/isomerase [Clostridiales bacterium]|jgi:mannobiose 2-epimerase|nr:AGE family epimerase/isomerase [Clostridiales bacterium]